MFLTGRAADPSFSADFRCRTNKITTHVSCNEHFIPGPNDIGYHFIVSLEPLVVVHQFYRDLTRTIHFACNDIHIPVDKSSASGWYQYIATSPQQ